MKGILLIAYLLIIAALGYLGRIIIRYAILQYKLAAFRREPKTQYAFIRDEDDKLTGRPVWRAVILVKYNPGKSSWDIDVPYLKKVTDTYYRFHNYRYTVRSTKIWPEWYASMLPNSLYYIHNSISYHYTIPDNTHERIPHPHRSNTSSKAV